MITSSHPIMCKLCHWTPQTESKWVCNCGHRWNTFLTGGKCPNCLKQWEYTACLKCSKNTDHLYWYGESVEHPTGWIKLINLWGLQYWNVFSHLEENSGDDRENWIMALTERIQLVTDLRESIELAPLSIEDLYSYYINNRPENLTEKHLTAFINITHDLNEYVDRFNRKGVASASEYLIVMGAPVYFIENAHIMDERIKQVNRLLNEGGYPLITPTKTEQMFKKLLAVNPEEELATSLKNDKKENSNAKDQKSNSGQYSLEFDTSIGYAKYIINNYLNVMEIDTIEEGPTYQNLVSIFAQRINSVNRLRTKLGLPIYSPKKMREYLENHPIQFDFLMQKFDLDDFVKFSDQLLSRLNESSTVKFNIDEYLLSAGFYSLSDRELLSVKRALKERELELLLEGAAEFPSLEKEKIILTLLDR